MIDVSEVVLDPDLCNAWTITRSPGQFVAGGWQALPQQTIQAFGAVRNANGKEIEMMPEGDRVHEAMTFRSTTQMYVTNAAGNATSDILTYQGVQYRVVMVKDYGAQGYFLALARRLAGD